MIPCSLTSPPASERCGAAAAPQLPVGRRGPASCPPTWHSGSCPGTKLCCGGPSGAGASARHVPAAFVVLLYISHTAGVEWGKGSDRPPPSCHAMPQSHPSPSPSFFPTLRCTLLPGTPPLSLSRSCWAPVSAACFLHSALWGQTNLFSLASQQEHAFMRVGCCHLLALPAAYLTA